MLEAYLKRPAGFIDKTGVPQAKYIEGTIKAVSDKQRLCYMTTSGRVANYSGKADAWRNVQCDSDTGRVWLENQARQFDEFRGGFLVALPDSLVGQRVYMLAEGNRARKGFTTWLAEWFLVSVYDAVCRKLKAELQRRGAECAAPIYSVSVIERLASEPVCDPVQKRFVSRHEESSVMIFKGNDLSAMQWLLDEYWPSTWAREIVIRNLGLDGEDDQPCSYLPWDPSTPLCRADQLLAK